MVYDAGQNVTFFTVDRNGDRATNMAITARGGHREFTHFVIKDLITPDMPLASQTSLSWRR